MSEVLKVFQKHKLFANRKNVLLVKDKWSTWEILFLHKVY